MKVRILLLSVFLFSVAAFAGEVHGGLKEGDKSVGPNVTVEIHCKSGTYAAQTDQYGSYRIYVRERGPCKLKVLYKKQDPPPDFEIQSYDDPQRYDFQLVLISDRYVLRRT